MVHNVKKKLVKINLLHHPLTQIVVIGFSIVILILIIIHVLKIAILQVLQISLMINVNLIILAKVALLNWM